MSMKITWKRCLTYASAKNSRGVIYLHEWNGKPFYWGLAEKFHVRYGASYSHWIEGCLQHGGRLYVGKPTGLGTFSLEDVEYALIGKYGSDENRKRKKAKTIEIIHTGNVPESIERPSAL